MKNWGLYRLILSFFPANRKMNASDMPKADASAVENVLNKYHCLPVFI